MTASAIQTFTSGKTKLIDFFVCEGEWFSSAGQQRSVKLQPAFPRRGSSHGLLNGREDKGARRTAPLCGFFAKLPVQATRDVDAGPNAVRLHYLYYDLARLK
jgi:hypothetical protein